jgi:hypothetical protein
LGERAESQTQERFEQDPPWPEATQRRASELVVLQMDGQQRGFRHLGALDDARHNGCWNAPWLAA